MLAQGSATEICYVSHDARRLVENWARTFGAGPFFAMEMSAEVEKDYRGASGQDSFIAMLGFLGTTLIEIVQPTNDAPSVFREVLDAKGDAAMHHIMPNIRTLTAREFDVICAKYTSQGFKPALSLSPPGLGRNILFDAVAHTGVFIEVLEVSPVVYTFVDKMYAAHITASDSRGTPRSFSELMT